jgi:hypothetical protein
MTTWIIWAAVLVGQSFSFTFVSRARNSASLRRHLFASVLSNGVWFASQVILFNKLIDILRGNEGLLPAVYAGAFYCFWTVVGSISAHKIALMTEKGKSSVGASTKYAQITVEEWSSIKAYFQYITTA